MPATTIRDIIYKFETWGIIAIQNATHYSVITIKKYNEYQTLENYLTTGKPPTNRRPTATDKECKKNDEEINNIRSFSKFWKSYPRKKDKQNAEKAWLKLSPDTSLVKVIISYIEVAKKSPAWTNSNEKYIPYPAKFINNRRWEDQPDPPGEEKGEYKNEKPGKYSNIGETVDV